MSLHSFAKDKSHKKSSIYLSRSPSIGEEIKEKVVIIAPYISIECKCKKIFFHIEKLNKADVHKKILKYDFVKLTKYR